MIFNFLTISYLKFKYRVKSVPTTHVKGDTSEELFYKPAESTSLKPESLNRENEENYSIKNNGTINKSNAQINNKLYSSDKPNSIPWPNRGQDQLTKVLNTQMYYFYL